MLSSCTPHGVLVLLREAGIVTSGAHAVVVGRSNIVGKPLSILLARRDCNATVTVCHTGTRDLPSITRQADILIAAIGKPRVIKADMIKKGAAVIDVGVNRVEDPSAKKGFRLVGDVDFEPACEVASFITPVPRGVGPMTIACSWKIPCLPPSARAENSPDLRCRGECCFDRYTERAGRPRCPAPESRHQGTEVSRACP